MKTAFIGAGRGCRAVLELYEQGDLEFLDLEILAVADVDPDAPGIRYAREKGWPTLNSIERALALPGLELAIELTGSDEVLDQIYSHLPLGVRVMDHVQARVFWDLEKASLKRRDELREKTDLQSRLAADRAQLREILDTIPDMVVVLDPEMRILRVNRRFESLAERSREEIEGLSCDEVLPHKEGTASSVDLTSPFRIVMRTGRPVTLIQYDERTPGKEVYFQVTANPIADGDGRIVSVVETASEITEEVLLKRETEESARRYRQITDAVHGLITIKDLEGRYEFVNPRAEKVLGLSREAMLGRTASELFPPEVADVIESHDREALDLGGHHTAEEIVRVGGQERALVTERFPLTDYRNKVVGLCAVARDYSRRRQLQRELVQTERLAAVGKLAAGVAHELNNPLSGIVTFAEDLLLESDADDPRRGDYEIILGEAMRCRRIVRELLEFSRQKRPERQRLQINSVVQRVLTLIERQASFHNIMFDVALDENLPETDIDQHQIQQVILNLVINARDAMNACGEITIRTETADGGSSVLLSVTDRGCGIPESKLGEIFEPFFSTKGEQGHGLGLAAVLSVVEGHGGRVEVDSKVDVGSTFRVILPAAAS